jgi:hypothetical protein
MALIVQNVAMASIGQMMKLATAFVVNVATGLAF